jgi:hypothetical protein
MKKCNSCGEKFDPDAPVSFDGLSEGMAQEIDRGMEYGRNCLDCLFATAFENESMKDV